MYSVSALKLRAVRQFDKETLCYCPFHDDHSPNSFFFNTDTGLYICYVCGAHGNVQQLAQQMNGEVISGAYHHEDLNQRRKLDLSGFMMLPNQSSQYTIGRGVSEKAIKEFDIRTSGAQTVFPVYDAIGGLKGCQVRYTYGDPRYRYFGDHVPFYPFRPMNPELPLFVVEGVFGVMRAYEAGVQAITLFGAGKKPDDFAVTFLLGHNSNVIIAYDNDPAGRTGSAKLSAALKWSVHQQFFEADELSVESWQDLAREYS